MIIDLHTHTTPRSGDSALELNVLIREAKRAGLDGICLTEHDCFWDKDILAKISHEQDFLVLPGAEIRTEAGHILVFGVEQYVFGMYNSEYLQRIVDEVGGFTILAHPYRRRLNGFDDISELVESCSQQPVFRCVNAMETMNGRGSERENRFSQELCCRLNSNGVGGSDAHSLLNVPSSATSFEREIGTVEELIRELKSGRFKPVDLRHGLPLNTGKGSDSQGGSDFPG